MDIMSAALSSANATSSATTSSSYELPPLAGATSVSASGATDASVTPSGEISGPGLEQHISPLVVSK